MASSLGKMASPSVRRSASLSPSRVANFLQRRVLPGPPTRVTRDRPTLLDIKFQKALSVLGSVWNPGGACSGKTSGRLFLSLKLMFSSVRHPAPRDRNTLESIYTN